MISGRNVSKAAIRWGQRHLGSKAVRQKRRPRSEAHRRNLAHLIRRFKPKIVKLPPHVRVSRKTMQSYADDEVLNAIDRLAKGRNLKLLGSIARAGSYMTGVAGVGVFFLGI